MKTIKKLPRNINLSMVLPVLLVAVALIAIACPSDTNNNEVEPLKIGYLADYSGSLAELSIAMERGIELAVEQINAAGGVNGQPVTYVTGDTALDSGMATVEARRLIDVEGVHAIVGAVASGITLVVAEGVTADAQIPHITPAATSPGLSNANDNDFLFRTALSDAAQGVVLANNLVEADGMDNVGVLYVNNPYGQGLSREFENNFDGTATLVSYEEDAPSFLAELRQAGTNGAEALVIVGYAETGVILRESLENDLFSTYYFVDANRSEELANVGGADKIEGLRGTSQASAIDTDSADAWNTAYIARYGALPNLPFVRETYDATIALALAAEAADSVEGPAIRDQLRAVATPGGIEVIASLDSITAGLEAVDDGTDVNYQGAASTVDWDSNGDITAGYVAIWEFQDGTPVNQEVIPFSIDNETSSEIEPLKIGFLADYSGSVSYFAPVVENGIQLAIEHLNAAGGVNGLPVSYVTGDTALDPIMSTTEARRLIEVEGVHAIVGPLVSALSLVVAEGVTSEAQIPQVTPASTAPSVTNADDDDFLFRTALSDKAQGAVLANNLVEADGVNNVGLIYFNNAYGQGLSREFENNFDGQVISVPYDGDSVLSYVQELREAARDGATDLVIVGYVETGEIIRQSLENGLFDNFYFVAANRSKDIVEGIGPEAVEGRRGTTQNSGPTNSSTTWDAAYIARFGMLPELAFAREAYDAVITIALATEAADSTDGTAIRDMLRPVASPGGELIIASQESVAAGLRAVDQGRDVNYEGAASSVDWDENGDIQAGYVAIWEFRDGVPVNLEPPIYFELE